MNFVKSLFKNVAVEAALLVVRGYLNKSIEKFTPSDMYEAIMQNRDLWIATPEQMVHQAKKFKNKYKGFFEKYIDEIDIELILKWIKDDHPDLYSIIIQPTPPDQTPKGVIWLNYQLMKIKNKILEM